MKTSAKTSIKKIGIDFHGVINTDTELFGNLSRIAAAHGAEVYIISGGPQNYIAEYLRQHQIKYDVLWCLFDYFVAQNKVEFLPDGSFHVEDNAWNTAKAEYCRQHGIDLLIDDSPVYGRYFKTPYCRYESKSKIGILPNNKIIDFSFPADDIWRQLESAG